MKLVNFIQNNDNWEELLLSIGIVTRRNNEIIRFKFEGVRNKTKVVLENCKEYIRESSYVILDENTLELVCNGFVYSKVVEVNEYRKQDNISTLVHPGGLGLMVYYHNNKWSLCVPSIIRIGEYYIDDIEKRNSILRSVQNRLRNDENINLPKGYTHLINVVSPNNGTNVNVDDFTIVYNQSVDLTDGSITMLDIDGLVKLSDFNTDDIEEYCYWGIIKRGADGDFIIPNKEHTLICSLYRYKSETKIYNALAELFYILDVDRIRELVVDKYYLEYVEHFNNALLKLKELNDRKDEIRLGFDNAVKTNSVPAYLEKIPRMIVKYIIKNDKADDHIGLLCNSEEIYGEYRVQFINDIRYGKI